MAIHMQVGKLSRKSVLRCFETSLYICALLDMYVDTLSTLGSLFSLPLTPCVVRVGDRSLTGYEPDFCCLAFGSAAEQIYTFIGSGGLAIYYRSSAA
jgi:hypothetical protein